MTQSELNVIQMAALEKFRKDYPSCSSGDLQSFVLGLKAMESCIPIEKEQHFVLNGDMADQFNESQENG